MAKASRIRKDGELDQRFKNNKSRKHNAVGGFVTAINEFVDEVAADAAANQIKEVYLACFAGIVTRSPVDQGTFRLSWFPAINALPTKVASQQKGSKDSGFQANRIEPIPDFRIGDLLVIGNNLPYAKRLESGWSKKAPQGVVAPTKRSVEAALRRRSA